MSAPTTIRFWRCAECVAVEGKQYECTVEHNSERHLHGNLEAGIMWGDASKPVKFKYYDEPYRELIRRAVSGTRKSVPLQTQSDLYTTINDFLHWAGSQSEFGRIDITSTTLSEYIRLKEGE